MAESGIEDELREVIDSVIQDLNGSCSNESVEEALIDTAMERGIFLSPKGLEMCLYEVDNVIFNCVGCGWWFEISEHAEGDHSETICQNCVEE